MNVGNLIKSVGALVCGLAVGMCVNMALIQLNMTVLYPMPAGVDMNDPVAFGSFIQGLPAQAFALVLVAHLGQSFVGAWIAARLAPTRPMLLAMVIGALSLLGGILAMAMIPGPAWLAVELPLYLVVAWLAGRREVQRRALRP